MRKILAALFLAALATAASWLPAAPQALANEPAMHVLGRTTLKLRGPDKHNWVNKNANLSLKLAPDRYDGVIGHMLSLYSHPSPNSLAKMFNNYAAVFYVGPSDKVWSREDFALLKTQLLPGGEEASPEELESKAACLQRFLLEGVDYKVSSSKARKYYKRLQGAAVLRESPDSVVLALRHKKKGEKDKNVTMSLALIKGKLLGTLYYQVEPGGKERQRAAALTMAWQEALVAANS